MAQPIRMLIITGMSGAGKTVAVQCMEDMGFFCVDNLPPALISKFSELVRQSDGSIRRVALVCDLRGGEFFPALFDALKDLEEQNQLEYQIVFLEADDETLVRRYKASRRKHPLATDHGRIVDGIACEREMPVMINIRMGCAMRYLSSQGKNASLLAPTTPASLPSSAGTMRTAAATRPSAYRANASRSG